MHDYLSDSASERADKIALVCGSQRVSYAGLEAHSNALANSLHSAGVRRGDRVLIFADNTIETAVSFWAALKANAVPSVVNPLTKAEKLAYLLDDCEPAALIADRHLYPTFFPAARRSPHLKTIIIVGEVDDAALASLPRAERWHVALARGDGSKPPERQCIDIDLASIIYTSGSTGDPKGVMLTHRNMLTACESIATYLELAHRRARR